MNRPPCLMRVRVGRPGRKINLWLPLFIIFLFVAVILLILSPLVLLAAVILWPFGWGRPLLAIIPAVIGCLWAMRGLKVEVEKGEEKVLVSVK